MSSLAQRNEEFDFANEFEWLDFSERIEMSPASVWVPDEEKEITNRPIKELKHLQATDASELGPSETTPRFCEFAESQVLPAEASFDTVTLTELGEQDIVEENVVEQWSLPEISPRVRVLDELQVLPAEASFATVTLNRPDEQNIVRENVVAASSLPETRPRVRVLDESQVLPGEASFATVSLNQPSEQNIVKENVVAGLGLAETLPRVRLFDESLVLPGEASFATVMSKEPVGSRTYSPVTEFFARTNLNSRTLMVATLLVVSILAITTLIILEITTGVFSSRRTANTASHSSAPNAEPAAAQTKALTTPKSLDPLAASSPQKQASQSRTPTPVPVKVEGAAETTKKLRVSVKEPVITTKGTASKGSKVNNSRSETKMKQRESSSLATDAAAVKRKGEPKAPPATGGAQRPRTVTP